jgi:hypothetical protein
VQPENTLVRTPNNLTDEEAAPLSMLGLTVWTCLIEQANIRAGQSILDLENKLKNFTPSNVRANIAVAVGIISVVLSLIAIILKLK